MFFNIDHLPQKEVLPGIKIKSVALKNLMITLVDLSPGAVLPVHSHVHEQITYCVSGSLELTVDGKKENLKMGKGASVPSGIKHSGIAGPTGAFVVDSWSPVRDDYIVYDM